MKKYRIDSIDKKLTELYQKLDKVAKRFGYRSIKAHRFFDVLSCNYHSVIDPEWGTRPSDLLKEAKKVIKSTDLIFSGMGATRLAVKFYHNKTPYILKLDMTFNKVNDNEIWYAKKYIVDKYDDVCLVPVYYWTNKKFKTVSVFKSTLVIKTKEYDPEAIVRDSKRTERYGIKRLSAPGVPERFQRMMDMTPDLHELNVGWVGNTPWLIDYDHNYV